MKHGIFRYLQAQNIYNLYWGQETTKFAQFITPLARIERHLIMTGIGKSPLSIFAWISAVVIEDFLGIVQATAAKNAHLAQIISPEIKLSTEAIFYY